MLRRGGNAFDAVAATAAALNVVEPFMSGLAGAGAFTYFNASTGEVSCRFIPPLLPTSYLRWTPKCPNKARLLLHARQLAGWHDSKPLRQTFI